MRISDWSSDVCSSDLCDAFECRIILGKRILDRLQMREHRHRTEAGRECELEVFDQIVSSLHTPGTRHEHMQCHETPTDGCASADCMEPDPARTIASEDLVEQCALAGATGVVHPTARS